MVIVNETNLPIPGSIRGKVRDTYDLGDKLLIVATDRISAFDVVLPNGIPQKGKVLNKLSAFWFDLTGHIVPNHLITSVESIDQLRPFFPDGADIPDYLIGRSMIVRKAERIPVECVVRGYISGSAWSEYEGSGTISGIAQSPGLKESQELPEILFTPTTKAESGHDEPMSWEEVVQEVGEDTAQQLRSKSFDVYRYARSYALEREIIIADTKFEFGFIDGKLSLIDEVLTPDSSRFWGIKEYIVGQSQPSFDKQPVRDWLTATGWNKQPPAPELPPDVIEATTKRYTQAYHLLTGRTLDDVPS